ncbi:MAG TPA: VWA domain-containing protein [Vicinamibacteria bacterium]
MAPTRATLLPGVVVLCLGAPATPASSAQVPSFGARVEVVKVSVLVKGGDGPILGLAAADFEVRDNGVAQEVERVQQEELPLGVILAFDVSGSVYGDELDHLKSSSHAVLDGLKPGDRATLVCFADGLSQLSPLQADLAPLRARIDALTAGGGTSLVDGIFAAIALGDAALGRALAVVFTDGQETASWLPESYALDAARRTEVVVYGVQVGWEGGEFLERVGSTTGGRLLHVGSSDRLRQAFLEILQEFRTRYVLRYTPRGVKRQGWHRLDIRVKGRSAKVVARKGYLVSR